MHELGEECGQIVQCHHKQWQSKECICEKQRNRPRRFPAPFVLINTGAMVKDMPHIGEDVGNIGEEENAYSYKREYLNLLRNGECTPVGVKSPQEQDANGEWDEGEEEIPDGSKDAEHGERS